MAAVGLLVWVIVAKFADHLPLYRLAQIAARQGVTLALPTLADWAGRIGVALQPGRSGNGSIVARQFDLT
jgi:transposase